MPPVLALPALALAVVLTAPAPAMSPVPSASDATVSAMPVAATSATPGWVIPTAAGEALIVNSGSTNRAGFRLSVYADGAIVLRQQLAGSPNPAPEVRKHVAKALATKLFADLKTAGALDRLPQVSCMKSASFGSRQWVAYLGVMSPDLSCPITSSTVLVLAADVSTLVTAAGAMQTPRR